MEWEWGFDRLKKNRATYVNKKPVKVHGVIVNQARLVDYYELGSHWEPHTSGQEPN